MLAGGPWGGGAVVVLALTKCLLEAGHQVTVLCLSDEVSRRFAAAGAKVVTFRHWRREINPLRDLLAYLEIYHFIKREQFDIVHTHTSKGGILGRLAARSAGTAVVIHTVHGFAFTELTRPVEQIFYLQVEKMAAHFCDMLISVNNEDRLLAIEAGIVAADKIVTILNGIDLSQFYPIQEVAALRHERGFSRNGFLVGTVGRLASQKGYEYLLRAIPDVLRYHPETYFVFAGEGPLRAEFQALADHTGIADHCRFLGFRQDIPQLLSCFDMFVMPSLKEGLSITLLEAMATGKAIVATDIRGNREVITHCINGIICRPMSSESLAEGIIQLIGNPALAQELGKQAHCDVIQRYDQRFMLEQTMNLYRQLLQKNSN